MKRKLQITIIGDSSEIEENNKIAYEVGCYIAKKGWILICGGKEGVMNAASKGAIENNGIVVAILPDNDINAGNPYKTISIATGIGYARNSINVLSGDIIISIGGGSGTLSEIAYAWAYNKPIIAFKNSIGWSKELSGKALDNRRNDFIIGVSSIEELDIEINRIISNLNINN